MMTPLIDQMKATAEQENERMRAICFDPADYGRRPEPSEKVAERRKRVAELRASGMTIKQVAEAMSMSVANVKSDAYYAKRA